MTRYFKPLTEVMEAILPLTREPSSLRVEQLDRRTYLLMQIYDPSSPQVQFPSLNYKTPFIGMVRRVDDALAFNSTEIIWMPDALTDPVFSSSCEEIARAVKSLEEKVTEKAA